MPQFDASSAAWLGKPIKFTREKVEIRARNSEKSSWRRALNIRKTKAVNGLPTAIPGQMSWKDGAAAREHRISFGWKSILPIPSKGISVHARDDKGIYLLCDGTACAHGGGAVARKTFKELAAEIAADFGLSSYSESFIYGQFYRSDAGTHTFVRLLPDKVDSFDSTVIDLLKARRIKAGAHFVFGALEVLAQAFAGKRDADLDRARARLLNGWRNAFAISRAVGSALMTDDSLPKWAAIKPELAKGAKADLAKIASELNAIAPDQGGEWSVEGIRKAGAVVARTFFAMQGLCLRTRGDLYLTGLGIQLVRDKINILGQGEEYRFPVLWEARTRFKAYLDAYMKVRQLSDNQKKNDDAAFARELAALLTTSVTDLEVLEIFGMNLAYTAWAKGYKVKVPVEPERTLWPSSPPLAGEWEMVERVAQPLADPDYPGFVVCVWKRGGDFLLTAKGTSSEDAKDCPPEKRTRDQADKAQKISTGVEADADPSGIAYHATKKYFKPILLEKMKALGFNPGSNLFITGHSLGGGLTERLHLKFYGAGYKNVWSMAFSPPALDARSMSKALYTDDQMGPAAFDHIAASGGTWDMVTKGGDTGACIPLRITCIRPWDPLAVTPVPFSVVGDNAGDMYFLQHGTMFQHECKVSGFVLKQVRKDGDVVAEDTDASYNVYDYCKDVTLAIAEAAHTPWAIELALKPDDHEQQIRKRYTTPIANDADRAEKGAMAQYVRQIVVVNDSEQADFKKEEARAALAQHLIDQGEKVQTAVRVYWVKGEEEMVKHIREATWASGCIVAPGAHFGSEKVREAVKDVKFKVVEVHMNAVDAAADKVASAAALRMNKGVFGYDEAMTWLVANGA